MVGNNSWLKNNAWVNYVRQTIEEQFPRLQANEYKLIGSDTDNYNCVAWAAEDTTSWWWPDSEDIHYWPANLSREETLEAFIQLFQMLGYEICDHGDLEIGFKKIAIYTDIKEIPTHVAKQTSDGKWTSKIGQNELIQHEKLESLTGDYPAYGIVSAFLKKTINN